MPTCTHQRNVKNIQELSIVVRKCSWNKGHKENTHTPCKERYCIISPTQDHKLKKPTENQSNLLPSPPFVECFRQNLEMPPLLESDVTHGVDASDEPFQESHLTRPEVLWLQMGQTCSNCWDLPMWFSGTCRGGINQQQITAAWEILRACPIHPFLQCSIQCGEKKNIHNHSGNIQKSTCKLWQNPFWANFRETCTNLKPL